ncbi:probable LRR receptor-like serine/threonine-protein kinase At3g47570 [Alnus glutinosa]|uniref:probable LRR receptor-like serine/threonine-protein kinase At3g47570 n=1 Tax=Alnus glutinosa TaxID=3517 RepID=UPI002D78D0FA|nr:probable LRR receptor-like serine/threonine-protein kinase At3g47570 [Alnus glutinosa]
MKFSCLHFNWILLIFFHGILLLKSARIHAFADESDRLALLDFKNRITEDPLQIMSSWNESTHFCNWFGVSCSPSSKRVMVLKLKGQRLGGTITPSMGNLTYLTGINLRNNSIYGEIPQELGRLQRLQHLNLSFNSIGGSLPTNLSHCTLPFEVGNLENLGVLDLSENRLYGEIPASLGSCTSLVNLYLEGNSFEVAIPPYLKTLRGLDEIDLSRNNLSGQIPEFFSKFLSLKLLNLSHNDLEGKVPSGGIFLNVSAISIFGNDKLCGGIPELLLPKCYRKSQRPSMKHLALKVVIPVMLSMPCSDASEAAGPSSSDLSDPGSGRKRNENEKEENFVSTGSSFNNRVAHEPSPSELTGSFASFTSLSLKDWRLACISYAELQASTNYFSVDNLIGSGSFGSVYKGVLSSNGAIVAVKVLNLQQRGASKSFIDECNALKSLRHRNLLKIITVCSSIDHQGNDFKSLVFEFMSNGSLDQWLHPLKDGQHQCKRLSFIQRIDIAIDVAYALEYLHLHCETPIVHCDIKPCNVLLNEDMVAHYGMGGQVSVLGDIYSYGILLLEMFTGKRPTDDMFKDALSIHKFIAMALPERVMDIVDSSIPFEEGEEDVDDETNNDDIEVDDHFVAGSRVKDCCAADWTVGLCNISS